VYIVDGVTIERSEFGPYVWVVSGTRISGCRVSNSIVGREAWLSRVELDRSMLGSGVVLEGFRGNTSLGDHSEVTTE
jgi:hypothetical protein